MHSVERVKSESVRGFPGRILCVNCLRTIYMVTWLAMAGPGQARAVTITELFGFSTATGDQPAASLIQASDGNFYGTTTLFGDDGHGCVGGCAGTIFKITPQGQFTTLYVFTYPWTNGKNPSDALVEGPDGNFMA